MTDTSSQSGPMGVGIIGAGNISEQYLNNLTRFPDLRVMAIADMFPEAARARAEQFGIEARDNVSDLLADDQIELVINLTIPAAHAEVSTAILESGKHVWGEKPLALGREDGDALVALAEQTGLRLGCAPDTFLGSGIQHALRLIDAGAIGKPLSAQTVFQTAGPHLWHPNPAFLFQRGAGPLFDMGPYYLTALVQAFGAIETVSAMGGRAFEQQVVASGPRAGEEFEVEVPTLVAALIGFEEGQVGQSTFSFQSPMMRSGYVEISGTEATLLIPDPNNFEGTLELYRLGSEEPELIESVGASAGRGMGALDIARSVRAGVPHRASGELGNHVLDAMIAIGESVASGQPERVGSTVSRAERLPESWDPFASTM